ncbi:MAG TPA: hypothetical protein VHV77_08230, partial [Pirellulales bacterium]|nr:hypothetical protein [Pirellulales bacterium]
NEEKAIAQLEAGREAFHAGNYAEAQKLAEQAIATFPEDVNAHQFRNLALFAQKKYRESAAGTYAVLAGGPGWNDKTLMSFYPDRKTYDAQLADLKHYAKQDPKSADGQFLLAYHDLVGGHRDAARAELEHVAKLEPKDQLTSELIKALSVEPKAEEKKAS